MASEQLNQAIALIKAGNKPAALSILKEVIQADPENENGWLWLYSCVDEVKQKKYCLQKALQINPNNFHARNALNKLTKLPSTSIQRAAPVKTAKKPSVSGRDRNTNQNWLYWFLAMGMGAFLFFCILSVIYLERTGQIPAVAANLPLFPSATLTPSPIPTATATLTPSPSPTITNTMTPTLGAAEILPLESLDSYRLQGKVTMGTESDTTSFTWVFTKEWVKASLAQRMIMSIQDLALPTDTEASEQSPAMIMETIVIDKTAWMKIENNWTRIDYQQSINQQSDIPSPIANWQSLTFVSDEIIHGIPCIHYTVDEDTFRVSGADNYQNMTMHMLGDIWIANQPGLPSVILRMEIQMQISGFFSSQVWATSDPLMQVTPQVLEGEEMVYWYEYDVTEVNTSIVIEPPEIATGY